MSQPYTLNKTDYKAIIRTGLIFLAPLGLIYLGQLTGTLQTEGHRIVVEDFLPTSFTLGAIALYTINRLTDILRKWVA